MMHLICIQTRHDHWSRHSGYHRYLSYLPADFSITLLRVPRGCDQKRDLHGWRRFCFGLAARVAMDHVNPWSTENDVLAELRVFERARSNVNQRLRTIVHFLDGEIGYNFFPDLRCLLGRRANMVRSVATFHQPGALLAGLLPHRERIAKLDVVMTVGSSQRDYFDFVSKDRLRFVPHGIDTNYYCPANATRSSDVVYCVTVGHWLRDFVALEALARSSPPGIRFRIVAKRELLKNFDGLPNVEVHSGIDDSALLSLYQDSDIGLLPLTDTTANNALLEMMACGLPIVATDTGSIRDYLPEAAGVLFAGNDVQTMRSAILHLAASPGERARRGQATRRRALELDWSVVAGQFADVYREL